MHAVMMGGFSTVAGMVFFRVRANKNCSSIATHGNERRLSTRRNSFHVEGNFRTNIAICNVRILTRRMRLLFYIVPMHKFKRTLAQYELFPPIPTTVGNRRSIVPRAHSDATRPKRDRPWYACVALVTLVSCV